MHDREYTCPDCHRVIDPMRMDSEERLRRSVACNTCAAFLVGWNAKKRYDADTPGGHHA